MKVLELEGAFNKEENGLSRDLLAKFRWQL